MFMQFNELSELKGLSELIRYPTNQPWHLIPIGEKINHEQVIINLRNSPNILVSGDVDSTKNILNEIVAHCLRSNLEWQLFSLDLVKNLDHYKNLPFTNRVANNSAEGTDMLMSLLDEMHTRYERLGNNQHFTEISGKIIAPIMVLVNDLTSLSWPYGLVGTPQVSNAKLNMKLMMMLSEIARFGPAVGIHLAVKACNLHVNDIYLRALLTCKIASSHLDSDISQKIFENEKANSIPNVSIKGFVKGRGYIQIETEEGEYFQAYAINTSYFEK